MSPNQSLTRIIEYPFAHLMQGARLDSFEDKGGKLHFKVQGLDCIESDVFERDGTLMERVTARHIPLEITFSDIQEVNRAEFFSTLAQYGIDDPSRIIGQMLSWKMPGMDETFHIFSMRGPIVANMNFFAGGATHEQQEGGEPFTFERDWSPAPPMADGEVPQPADLYDNYGGDPVTITIDGNTLEQKLFVGGLECQPDYRPKIDAVLNLGEKPSVWVKGSELHPSDRTVEKGEGTKGMSPAEVREEAEWVLERLHKGESVLIHCVAGMNRSTTICCAALMLAEGLSAKDALKRVRVNQPWAKPDSYHWLALRWLEKNK